MSEEDRKNCRTQGKYGNKYYKDDKKSFKNKDSKQKVSPPGKEIKEQKFSNRESGGNKGASSSFNSESDSPVTYQENAKHSFTELEEPKKAIEITTLGKHILSNTENGESSVLFSPHFYGDDKAAQLFETIYYETNWNEKNITINGVEYPQPRLVAWYGPFPYSYSGTTLEPAEMSETVLGIKRDVEKYLKNKGIDVELNSVLLNLYRDNKDSVAWHSDDELTMGICPTIASVSLGETRRFEMRRKPSKPHENKSLDSKEAEYFVHLNNGSLIIMDGCMQEDWQHRIPKEYHDRYERINLTFRTVYKNSPRSYHSKANHQPAEREITRKSDHNNIKLDEEDFPPLNFDSSHTSNVVKYSRSKALNISSSISSFDNFNRSHQRKNSEFPSSNETSLNTSDEMNQSVEWGDASSEINTTNESEELWDVKTCKYSPPKMNAADKSKKEWDVQTPSYNNTPSNMKTVYEPEEECTKASYRTNGELVKEQPYNASNYGVLNINNNFCESIKKQSNNTCNYEYSSRIYNSNESEKEWSNHSLENNLSEKTNDYFSETEEECTVDPICALNNLNDEKESLKITMPNKNLQTYDYSFKSNQINESVKLEDKNLSTTQRHNGTSYSSINKHESVCEVRNKPRSNRENWKPNLEAKEFFPVINKMPEPVEDNHYMQFSLYDLLDYKVDVMPLKSLLDYAFAVKDKVLKDLGKFKIREREDLQTYCELTDGSQSEKNQRLITSRIQSIILASFKREENYSQPKSFRNYGEYTHRNQNHYTFIKRNQDRGRASYHR